MQKIRKYHKMARNDKDPTNNSPVRAYNWVYRPASATPIHAATTRNEKKDEAVMLRLKPTRENRSVMSSTRARPQVSLRRPRVIEPATSKPPKTVMTKLMYDLPRVDPTRYGFVLWLYWLVWGCIGWLVLVALYWLVLHGCIGWCYIVG